MDRVYNVCASEDGIVLQRNGKDFLRLPASASVNGQYSSLVLSKEDGDRIVYSAESEKMVFDLMDDCIVVSYTKRFKEETPIYISKLFASETQGIELKGFDRAFCPQPRRGKQSRNLDFFRSLPDISGNGYNTPPILEFALGCPDGWVSMGLLDIPDTKVCRMDNDRSFLIESCGGNKVIPAGGEYHMPRVAVMFPKDEFDSVSLFRRKLIDFGLYTPKKPKFSEIPGWWKDPMICIYGDQMLEDRVGQLIDEEWVEQIVSIAEKEWGLEHINLTIDDSWQLPHSYVVDEKRFPNFRGFIDGMHERGHRVLLWQTPFFDKVTNGFETQTQKLGILSDKELTGGYFKSFPGCYPIDFTADNALEFIRSNVSFLFGSGEGQLNADGMKLDFLAQFRDPAENTYAHPERGIGYREVYLFYKMFYEEAKKVKPDVIIDATVGDPRFECFVDYNRMHDTHSGNIEKEFRVRLSALSCPGLLIDTDGALMYNSWLRGQYLGAAIYGIPANYYVKKFHDFADNERLPEEERLPDSRIYLTEREKKAFGNLFDMTKYRPDGIPVPEERLGDWKLMDGDRVNGIAQKGETVVYYPTDKNSTGYIFTFCDEAVMIPLYGHSIAQLTPPPLMGLLEVDHARDRALLRIKPGVVHTFKDIDDGSGIENVFCSGDGKDDSGAEVNYVN